MVLMIVHVGLRVPIPPIIISTGQHIQFFARIIHIAVYLYENGVSDKTMCNVTQNCVQCNAGHSMYSVMQDNIKRIQNITAADLTQMTIVLNDRIY